MSSVVKELHTIPLKEKAVCPNEDSWRGTSQFQLDVRRVTEPEWKHKVPEHPRSLIMSAIMDEFKSGKLWL